MSTFKVKLVYEADPITVEASRLIRDNAWAILLDDLGKTVFLVPVDQVIFVQEV